MQSKIVLKFLKQKLLCFSYFHHNFLKRQKKGGLKGERFFSWLNLPKFL